MRRRLRRCSGGRQTGRLDRSKGKLLVHVAGEAADADGPDALGAVERGYAAEEEGEERVEAGALGRVGLRLLGQLSRGGRVAPGCGVRLALRIQPRIRGGAVHRRRGDELAVVVRDEDGDGPGGLADDEVDDRA